MKLVIHEDLCIGCGVCVDVAPELIEMNEEQIAIMLVESTDNTELATEAVNCCPVDAIVAE